LVHDLKKLVTGVVILLIPEATYATVYLISFDYVLAILAMGGIAISELATALYLLKRS
jgi:hypothetical protein